jgi:maltoporin
MARSRKCVNGLAAAAAAAAAVAVAVKVKYHSYSRSPVLPTVRGSCVTANFMP